MDFFNVRSDKMILEPKSRMKERGLDSPDDADALAMTWGARIPRRDIPASDAYVGYKHREGSEVSIQSWGSI